MKITKVDAGFNNIKEIQNTLNEYFKGETVDVMMGFPSKHEKITHVFIKEINGKTKGITVAYNRLQDVYSAYICRIEGDKLYMDVWGDTKITLSDEKED